MYKKITLFTTLLLLLSTNFSTTAMAEQNITIIAPTSEVAEGLDLYAVSELFKSTANLEEFEEELNDPNQGINNLDLDGNGYVDFIRVVEEIIDETHIIILQAAIGEDELQDVATIEVENTGSNYSMHVHGNTVIYGDNYYIAPNRVHISTWPIIAWIYRPVYRPYNSVYHWGAYPRMWRPFRPLNIKTYRDRTHRYTKRNSFVVSRVKRVSAVKRVKYKPRTSVRVKKYVAVKKSTNKTTRKTSVKKGTSRKINRNVTKQTTKKGKKTTVNKNAKNTIVKKNKVIKKETKKETKKKTKKSKDEKEVTKKKTKKSN